MAKPSVGSPVIFTSGSPGGSGSPLKDFLDSPATRFCGYTAYCTKTAHTARLHTCALQEGGELPEAHGAEEPGEQAAAHPAGGGEDREAVRHGRGQE